MTTARAPMTLECRARAGRGACDGHGAQRRVGCGTLPLRQRRRADDKSESWAGLVTRRWVRAGRTSPRRSYSITGRAAGSWPCSWRSGLTFTAAVDSVLRGGDDRRLGLMARE